MPEQASTFCNFCGADLTGFNSCREVYNELSYYTLQHGDQKYFIHQLIVDAYAAQHAAENLKPITNAFALIGLYLVVEKNYTGKEVQNMHMLLAKNKRQWPLFNPPKQAAVINAKNVLETKPSTERDLIIKNWAKAVWSSWTGEHARVAELI